MGEGSLGFDLLGRQRYRSRFQQTNPDRKRPFLFQIVQKYDWLAVSINSDGAYGHLDPFHIL
jgi:hypothetical protein